MGPAVVEVVLDERASVRSQRFALREQRSRRHQQADRVLHGIAGVHQILALHEVEHLGVGVERGPRRERDPGGPERDASGPHGSEGGGDVGPRVALVEMGEHGIAQRLDGGDDEETAEGAKLRQVLALAEQVLDLRRDIEGDRRELTVKRARDVERVAGAVQEVGLAERDVSGAGAGAGWRASWTSASSASPLMTESARRRKRCSAFSVAYRP